MTLQDRRERGWLDAENVSLDCEEYPRWLDDPARRMEERNEPPLILSLPPDCEQNCEWEARHFSRAMKESSMTDVQRLRSCAWLPVPDPGWEREIAALSNEEFDGLMEPLLANGREKFLVLQQASPANHRVLAMRWLNLPRA